MNDGPDMTGSFDGFLHHATTRSRAEAALAGGMPAHRSFWGVPEIARYYAETVEDDGDEAVILRAPLSAFEETLLDEDGPGFEEPISAVIGCSECSIHAAWSRCDRSWRSSLDLIGSVSYKGALPASALSVV